MTITKKKTQTEQRWWRFLLLEVLIPEKESEKFESNFRTVASLIIIISVWQKEKRCGCSIFTGPQHFCHDTSQRQDSGQFHPNPLILVMGLYKGGLANYSFKWNLKFMMSWKSHWDFYVVLPPNAELSQGIEKQLAWFVTITPEGYWLEGTDSGLVAGRSMVFPD